jgi:outer membrane protein assembly factor BamB
VIPTAAGGYVPAVILLALALTGCAGLELSRPFRAMPEDWTQSGGDGGRRHVSPEPPLLPWKRVWQYNAQGGMLATPLVRDSIAILGTLNGELQAVELRTGKRLGYQKVGGPVRGTPALSGTMVMVPVSSPKAASLIAIDVKEGRRVWEMMLGPIESSLLLDNGRLFAATLEGRVFCLNAATGEEHWRYQVGTKNDRKPIRSAPAMISGLVVFGSDAGLVTALDAPTGQLRWSVRMSSSVFAGAAASEGTVVIGDLLGRVVGIDGATGSVQWTRELGSPVYASAAVEGGACYVPAADGRVVALDLRTGTEVWTFRAKSVVNASPLVAGSKLLVPSLDRSLTILDRRTGEAMDRIEVEGRVKVTPVVWQGMVLLSFEDKNVAAYVHEVRQ